MKQIKNSYQNPEELLNDFSGKIKENRPLSEWSKDERTEFVLLIIYIMAQGCGGLSYFWQEKDREMVLEGWIRHLEDCRPQQIIKTKDLVFSGKYEKRGDYVPRNAIDFKIFMQNGTHNLIPDYYQPPQNVPMLDHDKQAAREKSLALAKVEIEKMKAMLPKVKKSFKQLQEEAGRITL
jgi:hypothetical protein